MTSHKLRITILLFPLLPLLIAGCASSKIGPGDSPAAILKYESWFDAHEHLTRRTFCAGDDSFLYLRHKKKRAFVLERYRADLTVDLQLPFRWEDDEVVTQLIPHGNDFSILSIVEDDDLWTVKARRVDMEGKSIGEPQLVYAAKEEMEENSVITFSPDSTKILIYALGKINRRDGDRTIRLYNRRLEGVIIDTSLQVVDSFRITVPHADLKNKIVISAAYPSNEGDLLFFNVQNRYPGFLVTGLMYSGSDDKPFIVLEQELPMMEESVRESTPVQMSIMTDGRSKFEGLLHFRTGDHLTALVRIQWDFERKVINSTQVFTATEELAKQLIDDDEFEDMWIHESLLLENGSFVTLLSDFYFDEGDRTSELGKPRYTSYTIAKECLVLVFDSTNALSQSILLDRDDFGRSAAIGRLERPFTTRLDGNTLHVLMHKLDHEEYVIYGIDLEKKKDLTSKLLLKVGDGTIVPGDLITWLGDGSIMLVLKKGLKGNTWSLARVKP